MNIFPHLCYAHRYDYIHALRDTSLSDFRSPSSTFNSSLERFLDLKKVALVYWLNRYYDLGRIQSSTLCYSKFKVNEAIATKLL